jgi:hypothetical protein
MTPTAFRTDAHATRGATAGENARGILSGAPPLCGGAESENAAMGKDAPASFDFTPQTTLRSAQDASLAFSDSCSCRVRCHGA